MGRDSAAQGRQQKYSSGTRGVQNGIACAVGYLQQLRRPVSV